MIDSEYVAEMETLLFDESLNHDHLKMIPTGKSFNCWDYFRWSQIYVKFMEKTKRQSVFAKVVKLLPEMPGSMLKLRNAQKKEKQIRQSIVECNEQFFRFAARNEETIISLRDSGNDEEEEWCFKAFVNELTSYDLSELATKLMYLCVDLTQCERQVKDLKHIVYLNAKLMRKMYNVLDKLRCFHISWYPSALSPLSLPGLFHIERALKGTKNRKQFLEALKGVTHGPIEHKYHATCLLELRFLGEYED